MATAITSIAMIDATKASFASDAYGSWISCAGLALLLPSSTVYPSRKRRLDGASLCVSKMCQGERTVLVMADRGLYAAWLYQAIQANGWHPFLRVKKDLSFRAEARRSVWDHWGASQANRA